MKGKLDVDTYFARLAAEGMYTEKSRKAMKGIAHEVNDLIQEKRLQPIIRTSYYRCAFQLSTSNDVRVSLDTQMTLLNEFVGEDHPNEPWCRVSSDLLTADEIYRFPYAILEIKLQNVTENPEWLQETLADIEAIQVHKFSKFQHAMAFLHPERVLVLPHWHKDFMEWEENKKRAEAKVNQPLTGSQARAILATPSHASMDDMTVPRIRAEVAPTGHGHKLKDMESMDPKAVFAAERTLLHYAEKGLYVGALGVACLYRGGFVMALGIILVVVTLIFYIWTLCEYYNRLGRIRSRASVAKSTTLRLDLAQGPLFLTGLVVLVLAATAANVGSQIQASLA